MAFPSPARLRALHTLRLRGCCAAEALRDAAGPDAAAELPGLAADGLATERTGRLAGWMLTADGRATAAKLVAEELDEARCRRVVQKCYEQFLAVNRDLLGVCTDWQVRTVDGAAVPNDHADPAYDAAVVDRLQEIDRRVQPVCRALGTVLERFSGYGPRLHDAAQKVAAGATDWFTKPLIDSYHTVWFELHEDLLSTLGHERSKEPT